MMEDKVDYAPHYLTAKQNIIKVYELLNKHEFVQALALIDDTLVELRLMRNAVSTYAD